MDSLTFFKKKPKGEHWSGSFGLEATLTPETAKNLKMVAALKRFAKELCRQNGYEGVAITSIGIMPMTDTQDECIIMGE